MRRYRWASLAVDSDLALPELRRSRAASADIRVLVGASRARTSYLWIHEWRLPDGARWAAIARHRGGHVLRFGPYADFRIAADRRTIVVAPGPAARDEILRHLLIDQVLPAAAAPAGTIAMHASAVAIDGAAVLFAGPTHRGKSTIAGAFGVAGLPILADDCLLIDPRGHDTVAIPTYASLRLWHDAADRLSLTERCARRRPESVAKVRIPERGGGAGDRSIRFERRPHLVGAIYLLSRGGRRIRIEPVSRRDACIELLRCSFRLDPWDRPALSRDLEALARIAAAVPVARLTVPSALSAIDEVRAFVIARTLASAAA